MSETTMSERKPRAGLYKGPTSASFHDRDFRRIESILPEVTDSLDTMITRSLEAAQQAGRSHATMVDIGSGDGGLIRNLLSDPQAGFQAREFLRTHPDFTMRLIGLTDASEAKDHLRENPLNADTTQLDEENAAINTRIDAHNYFYSLTRTQTLNDFFQTQDIDTVDFAVAIESLRYMSPVVFEEVMQATLARMPSGAQFLATSFVGSHAGFTGSKNERLNVQHIPPGVSRKSLLYDNNNRSDRVAIQKGTLSGNQVAEQTAFDQAATTYQRLGVLTEEEITTEQQAIEADEHTRNLHPRQKFHMLANRTLSQGFDRLRSRKNTERTQRKLGILTSLEGIHVQPFRPQNDLPSGFLITKN